MKNLLVFFLLTQLFVSCQKELSGEGSNINTVPIISSNTVISSLQPNTKRLGYMLDSGIIALPNESANQKFDYSLVPNGTPWSDSLKQPENVTAFPTASYMTGFNLDILGQSINGNEYFQLSNSQWSNLGNYFSPAINIDLQGYSLNIPAQASKNNSAQILVNFPIAYNDSFNQTSTSAFTFDAGGTFNGFTFSGPITITTSTKIISNNIGYGNLKIRGYTDSMAVVVQRYTTTVTNSFSSTNFLINSLLSGLISQAGVDPNQSIITTEYRFWAVNKGLVMQLTANGMAFVRTGL
jgi:hypothetical protein